MIKLSTVDRIPTVGRMRGHYPSGPRRGNRAGLLSTLLLVSWGTACGPATVPEWSEENGFRWRELTQAQGGGEGFRVRSPRRTGVDFKNVLSNQSSIENDHLLIGSGVALGDVDGDGWADVYFSSLQGSNRLFRNRGNWRFEDVTEIARVGLAGRNSTGAVFADVDGDGDLDLFVTALGDPNALLLNDGTGVFTEVTEAAGLESSLGSTTSTLADIDGDGDLDLYVAQYKSRSAADELRPFERNIRLTVGIGDDLAIAPEFTDHFRLEFRGGVLVPVERGEPDLLYLNDGDGRFTLMGTEDQRFLDESGDPISGVLDDFGLAARFHDVDGDGDADLYVCNDFDHPDHFWLNDGDGRFRRAPWQALRTTSYASMAVDFSDVDRDGNVDIFVADMRSRDRERRQRQRPLHRLFTKTPGAYRDRVQFQRNTLQMGRGDGTFSQVSEMAGVDASEWSWGSAFLDVDLDGWEDLLIANGHGRDMQDADALEEIVRMRGRMSWTEAKLTYPGLETPNVAFRNRGDGTFEEVGFLWNWGVEDDVSQGIAYADLDLDGDLDMVVNRLGSVARMLENVTTAPRVSVSLRGAAGNTHGIGAQVVLVSPGLPRQSKEVTAGGLYLSGAGTSVSFAAATREEMVVEIRWVGGARSRIEGVIAGRHYDVQQVVQEEVQQQIDEAVRREVPGPEEFGSGVLVGQPGGPLFEDVSDLLGHEHTDSAFNDLRMQPLLPTLMSRLGPGLSWVRPSPESGPYLVIPSGAGGSLTVRGYEGGAFVERASLPTAVDQTMAITIPLGRQNRLLVGQASYEVAASERASIAWGTSALLSSNGSLGPELGLGPAAARSAGSTGPLASADYDGDGDLDLFVGGRVLPGEFPRPTRSRLLRNENGDWTEDAEATTVLSVVRMASSAVFSDLDADGDPDLIIAEDGGPIRILMNEGGKFSDRTAALGMAAGIGRWNGVTTGDLNGDGRLDIVATSWGRNLPYRPEPDRPLVLVHGDFDRNGSWDILEARGAGPDGDLFPTSRLESLQSSWPQLRLQFPTFQEYAKSDVARVTRSATENLALVEITTVEHTLFLNYGGNFEAVALPAVAQRAPAFHAGIGDMNGDGNEDVLLTQNFFATPTPRARFDGGRGLVLLGDGKGGLNPLSGTDSGIRVYGEQRGAAFSDYDADGRIDVAMAQNASRTKVFHNRGARVGLRVRVNAGPDNPWGVGTVLRVRYPSGLGPAREIHSGSGYWSVDDPLVVLGLREPPTGVLVRWPDGREIEAPLEEGQMQITIPRGEDER
jgi:enediyne biosynthesis protein E4